MASQQTSNGPDNPSLAISPGLIVGIVIVAAFFSTIIFASIYRFYGRRGKGSSGLSSAAFAAREYEDITGIADFDAYFWNPNRQRSTAQMTRMKEVRWINNMYAWERGREARMEAGEIRPPTMMMGRKGENKSWDEYTVAEDSSGQESSGHASGEYPGGPYFYNADHPYANSQSQQFHRMSHMTTPPRHPRASYQSTITNNGMLPRQHSALLPPVFQSNEAGGAVRKSPLRNEYQFGARGQESIRLGAASAARATMTSPEYTPNPKITVNDDDHDLTKSSPPFADDTNYETIMLSEDGARSPESQSRGRAYANSADKSPPNFSRPREGTTARPDQRPSVIVTDGSLPQLQLQFDPPQSKQQQQQPLHQSYHSVSVYDEDEAVDLNSPEGNERRTMDRFETPAHSKHVLENRAEHHDDEPRRHGSSRGKMKTISVVEGDDFDGDEDKPETEEGAEIPKSDVKNIIQEWERVNGSYAREYRSRAR